VGVQCRWRRMYSRRIYERSAPPPERGRLGGGAVPVAMNVQSENLRAIGSSPGTGEAGWGCSAGGDECTVGEFTSDRLLPRNGGGWVGVQRRWRRMYSRRIYERSAPPPERGRLGGGAAPVAMNVQSENLRAIGSSPGTGEAGWGCSAGGDECTVGELTSDRLLPRNGGGWVGVQRRWR